MDAAQHLACAAVLFDCDGVLVDSDATVVSAWTRWAGDVGLDPAAVLSMIHGRRSADTVTALLPAADVPDALARIDRYEIEDAAAVVAIPGAVDLVRSMPAGTWAVVTSGTRALATARLRAAGLPVPDVLVTADDVEHGKPHPEGYARAARDLGVPAERTVVLEDVAAGMRAGRAAGARYVVGVGERDDEGEADVRVRDLRALRWTGDGLAVGDG